MANNENDHLRPLLRHDEALYELHAETCKVFTSPVRLMILDLLRDEERSVSELAEALDLHQPHISQHLAVLREKGIVLSRRSGTTHYYRVACPQIFVAFDLIWDVILERLNRNVWIAEEIEGE